MTLYLEQFLDGLMTVPPTLRRQLAQVQTLDSQLVQRLNSINHLMRDSTRSATKAKQRQLMGAIENGLLAARGLSEEKVSISEAAYDLVDRHIQALDNELARFEADLVNRRRSDARRGRKRRSEELISALHRKSRKEEEEAEGPDLARQLQTTLRGANVYDMSIDPHEPRYCLCQQVCYGDMIACDNRACKVEWFHFNCVSLASKPKGRWFCPDCRRN